MSYKILRAYSKLDIEVKIEIMKIYKINEDKKNYKENKL